MIQVLFLKKNNEIMQVEVSGHAYSGEPNFDLVCAGVSTVMIGALNGFDQMVDTAECVMTDEPYVKIKVTKSTELSHNLFNFLYLQLKTVEESEGQYLRITEKEVAS